MKAKKENELLSVLSGTHIKDVKTYLLKSVIGFISAGGSTGATTIACTCAVNLAKMGFSVCYIETNILFPMAHSLLINSKNFFEKRGDLLTYGEDKASDVIMKTTVENLYLVSCKNRGLQDCLSPRDNNDKMEKLINELNDLVDFVIIDIDMALTNINAACMLKCDTVYQVWDENPKCYIHSKAFTTFMIEMGAQIHKILKVIINKKTNLQLPTKIFGEHSYKLICALPLSESVPSLAWRGKTLNDLSSLNKVDQLIANGIQKLMDDIMGTSTYMKK